MAYLPSVDVSVFPVAKPRKKGIIETRLFNEYNVSGIIRQLLSPSNPGFVTNYEDDGNGNYKIDFNLYGYQFRINLSNSFLITLTSSSYNGIYAYIILDTSIDEIYGQDNADTYEGLGILANESEVTALEAETNKEGTNKKLVYIKLADINKDGGIVRLNRLPNDTFLGFAIGGIDGRWNS